MLGRAGALGPSRWATLAPGPGRARVCCGAAARPYGRAEAGSGGRAAALGATTCSEVQQNPSFSITLIHGGVKNGI